MYNGDTGKYSQDATNENLTAVYKHTGVLMGILIDQKKCIKEDKTHMY